MDSTEKHGGEDGAGSGQRGRKSSKIIGKPNKKIKVFINAWCRVFLSTIGK